MLDFVIKYWLEFLFGIIALGLTAAVKHYYSLAKKQRQTEIKEEKNEWTSEVLRAVETLREELRTDIKARKEENRRQDKEIETVRQGVLALWRKVFLQDGRMLLEEEHLITYDEYMHYINEHNIYNLLGGNDEGDKQFALVTSKYESHLQKHK